MQYRPPIESRTTNQLIEIVISPEDWQPEALELARKELLKRGFTLEMQEKKRKNAIARKKRIAAIKAKASYTNIEKVLIVIFGPASILLLEDFFSFHTGEGFEKKNKQGRIFLLLGILLWVLVFYIIIKWT